MYDPDVVAACGDVAAIGSYNGREIYVQNTRTSNWNYYNDPADPKYHGSPETGR